MRKPHRNSCWHNWKLYKVTTTSRIKGNSHFTRWKLNVFFYDQDSFGCGFSICGDLQKLSGPGSQLWMILMEPGLVHVARRCHCQPQAHCGPVALILFQWNQLEPLWWTDHNPKALAGDNSDLCIMTFPECTWAFEQRVQRKSSDAQKSETKGVWIEAVVRPSSCCYRWSAQKPPQEPETWVCCPLPIPETLRLGGAVTHGTTALWGLSQPPCTMLFTTFLGSRRWGQNLKHSHREVSPRFVSFDKLYCHNGHLGYF